MENRNEEWQVASGGWQMSDEGRVLRDKNRVAGTRVRAAFQPLHALVSCSWYHRWLESHFRGFHTAVTSGF